MESLNESIFRLPFKAFQIRHRLLIQRCFLRDTVTGLNPGLGYGILGLATAYGKCQLDRRFTRLAHERASGELSYSENWFEKLSFAVVCSFLLATSVPHSISGARYFRSTVLMVHPAHHWMMSCTPDCARLSQG